MRCHCERRMAMWSAAVHRVGSRTRLQRLSVEPAHPPVGPDIVGRPGFSASGFAAGGAGRRGLGGYNGSIGSPMFTWGV